MNTQVSFNTVTSEPQLQQYLHKDYNTVPGFLWNEASATTILLNKFQQELGVTGDACEIGLWYGKYFILLTLLLRANEKSVGVDSFVHSADPETQERQFREYLAENLPDTGRCEVVKRDSQQLKSEDLAPEGRRFRLFSVDGDHTTGGALHDLELAAETIVPGGIVLLDDFCNPICPGVAEAYFKFTHSGRFSNLKPFAYVANKLLLADAEYAPKYYKMLLRELDTNTKLPFRNQPMEFHQTQERLNIPVTIFDSDILVILPNSWQQ